MSPDLGTRNTGTSVYHVQKSNVGMYFYENQRIYWQVSDRTYRVRVRYSSYRQVRGGNERHSRPNAIFKDICRFLRSRNEVTYTILCRHLFEAVKENNRKVMETIIDLPGFEWKGLLPGSRIEPIVRERRKKPCTKTSLIHYLVDKTSHSNSDSFSYAIKYLARKGADLMIRDTKLMTFIDLLIKQKKHTLLFSILGMEEGTLPIPPDLLSRIEAHREYREEHFRTLIIRAKVHGVELNPDISEKCTLFEYLLIQKRYDCAVTMLEQGSGARTLGANPFLILRPLNDPYLILRLVIRLVETCPDKMPLDLRTWLEPLLSAMRRNRILGRENFLTPLAMKQLDQIVFPAHGKTLYTGIFLEEYINTYLTSDLTGDDTFLARVAKNTLNPFTGVVANYPGRRYSRFVNLVRICHRLPLVYGGLISLDTIFSVPPPTRRINVFGAVPWTSLEEEIKVIEMIDSCYYDELVPADYHLLPCYLQEIIRMTTLVWRLGATHRALAFGSLPVELLFLIFSFLVASPS